MIKEAATSHVQAGPTFNSSEGTGACIDVLVIGGSQAGLAAGYYLKKAGIPHLIIDAHSAIGDSWRNRWDSLRTFSPAVFNSLPGVPFPAPKNYMPDKNEMAAYLSAYASKFALPVQLNTRAQRLSREGALFVTETSAGVIHSQNVIVATGAYHEPYVPPVAQKLDQRIIQLHSKDYKNPAQLPEGKILVVGTGASGVQIATELAQEREVVLSGKINNSLPRTVLGIDIFYWLYRLGIFTIPVNSFIGKQVKKRNFSKGDELLGIDMQQVIKDYNIKHYLKFVDVKGKELIFENGTERGVNGIVWCTGYRPNYQWIDLDILGNDQYPDHVNGITKQVPGLYFVGLRYQSRINSSLIGGVGKDAEYIVKHIGTSMVKEKTKP